MSETDTATQSRPVPDGMPPTLDAAKAAFQAQLPKVSKGETAKVKSDKANYSYKYVDMADLVQAALPLLGSLGMAFTGRPTLNAGGKFVLAYKLSHISGDAEEGEWPLPSPENFAPQAVGSAITYARRYCLLAVTGIHPDGEDDDGHAAGPATPRSAAEAFENARPASPRNGQAPRPQEPVREPTAEDLDPDAQCFADEAYVATTLHELEDVKRRAREAHKLDAIVRSPGNGRIAGFGQLFAWKHRELEEVEKALAGLHRAAMQAKIPADGLDEHVKKVTGQAIEGATAAQLRQAAAALTGQPGEGQAPPADGPAAPAAPQEDAKWVQEFCASLGEAMSSGALSGLQQRLGPAIANRTITAETASDLSSQVAAKRRELQGVPA